MAVESAIGSRFFVDGYDISGDVGQIGTIRIANTPLDISNITESAIRRIRGRQSGEMVWNCYFNDAAAQEHVALKSINRNNRYAMWAHQCAAIGDSGLAMLGKQMNYDWTLGADGGLIGSVQMLSSGPPVEAGQLITPGKRTDTSATNGSSLDGAASSSFGMAAYAFLTDFSGTDITLTIQDSANDSTFAAITGGAFTAFTAVGAQRIQTAVDGTVRRYVRVASSGTFTTATFVVLFVRYSTTQTLYS